MWLVVTFSSYKWVLSISLPKHYLIISQFIPSGIQTPTYISLGFIICCSLIFPCPSIEELNCKEGRTPKNWCLQTVVLEKTPESPLENKEIKPINLKGDQPWIFTGRTEVEAEAPVFQSSDENRWLIGKDHDARTHRGQKGKRASEDEMAGWHHWHNEHELGQTLRDGEGQGGLDCSSPWGHKALDITEWLHNNKYTI